MDINMYEAAGYYDYNFARGSKNISFPLDQLVLDTDHYAAGFCTCSSEGKIHILCETGLSSASDCMEDLDSLFQKYTGKNTGFMEFLGADREQFDHFMKNYYRSGKQIDSVFKASSGMEIKCSHIDEIFKPVKTKMEELLSSLDKMWERAGFDEGKTRILIVGKAALLYPVIYFIKSFFAFDPFMADRRFMIDQYRDKPDAVLSLGRELYRNETEAGKEIWLYLYPGDGKEPEKKKLLFPDGEEIVPEYTEPVFVAANDVIRLEIGQEKRSVSLPWKEKVTDCDVVELGTCLKNGKPVVRIRRYGDGSCFHDFPVT